MGKLRDRMLVDLQLSKAKWSTQRSYLGEAENLAKYFHKSPEQLSGDELKAYLLYLVKSGCRIEDRRLADSLEGCLAIDLVVAWRIYGLTMVGCEKPETPCDQFLSEEQWRVLGAWATGQMADTPPSAQQAMGWIGKVGGWLARGKEDNPGTTCMWRGLVRLANMVQAYMLALQVHNIRDGP